MRAVWSIGLAVLAVSGILLGADVLALRRIAVADAEERPGADLAPQRVLTRIQADLERVAAGRSPMLLPEAVARDPLEHLVDATDAFLRRRDNLFHDHLALARAEALRRLARQDEVIRARPAPGSQDRMVSPIAYGAALTPSPRTPPLLALVQTMRLVDAVLLLEAAETAFRPMGYDLEHRRNLWVRTGGDVFSRDAFLDDIWLRLPCPMVVGRRADFEAVARQLGPLGGPLLSCPVAADLRQDFALLERLAGDPRGFAKLAPPSPPPLPRYDETQPPPWDRDAAIRFMADNPDAAESPLRLATLDDPLARLDLALFLHAFRDPSSARDDEIRTLMAGIERSALAKASPAQLRLAGQPRPYDGSDESLVPSLRLAALTGIVTVASGNSRYPAVIPCAVGQRRPALLAAATVPPAEADAGLDLHWPVSGCVAGRGKVEGFPEADFAAFLIATAAADGGGSANHRKLPRYPMAVADLGRMARIVFDPRALLSEPAPVMDYPYQTWGYASLINHATALDLRRRFETARTSLARWFGGKGLDAAESAAAAGRALFASAYGSGCGEGPPPRSLRRLLVDEAPVAEIAAYLKEPQPDDLKPFADCAVFAPPDPMLLVAVGHPAALPLVWDAAATVAAETDVEDLRAVRRVNGRNHFGKTALMAAAQANRLDSVRFLLDHGARVNLDTWQTAKLRTLAHDSRTALMYAAGNGSAALIDLLLAAGADRFQTDSTGRRALDYLLGTGPGPANGQVTPAERLRLTRALY